MKMYHHQQKKLKNSKDLKSLKYQIMILYYHFIWSISIPLLMLEHWQGFFIYLKTYERKKEVNNYEQE